MLWWACENTANFTSFGEVVHSQGTNKFLWNVDLLDVQITGMSVVERWVHLYYQLIFDMVLFITS